MNRSRPDLERLPLLAALPKASRASLLKHAVVHTVGAGTILFEQGDPPNFQHVLLSGSVQLLGRSGRGQEVLIEVVSPPEMIVPAAVVTGQPYLMRARVTEPSRILLIEAAAFRAALSAEPALAQALIEGLAGQFRRLVRQIKSLKLRSTSERTGCHLLALGRAQGTPKRAALPYGKALVASELGMTRESFSRALASLRGLGVSVKGDTVEIADPAALAQACGFDPLVDGPPER
jgi:CRP/FNR family transcriptional regulator, transcriptional activator FtrB